MHLAQKRGRAADLMLRDLVRICSGNPSICTKRGPVFSGPLFVVWQEREKRAGKGRDCSAAPPRVFPASFVRFDQADNVSGQAHSFALCFGFVFGKLTLFHPKADLLQILLLVSLACFVSCFGISFVFAHSITPVQIIAHNVLFVKPRNFETALSNFFEKM